MIPEELKKLDQWVCSSKYNKIPYIADRPEPASSSNSDTWRDFNTAKESVLIGNYDYLGFVFHNNGIVGIDIDKGFEDDDNSIMNQMTLDIISRCQSYTELSKSGRGFHIFVKGVLPFSGKNNRRGLEIYQDSRFFVMTGRQRFYSELIENQPAIDYILETYFREEVRQHKEAGNIKPRYYNPKTKINIAEGKIVLSKEYPDISEGSRNNSLLSLGGQLLSAGKTPKEIYEILSNVNKTKVHPPLTDREIQTIAKSVEKYRK